MTTTRRDQQLALIWHALEFCVVVLLALSMALGGGTLSEGGWISWSRWNPAWRLGDVVDAELEVVPAIEEISA